MMTRIAPIVCPLMLIVTFICNTFASGPVIVSNKCMGCHEDVYMKALSYRYQHSVVIRQCPLCHIHPVSNDIVKKKLNVSSFTSDCIVYLDDLSEDQSYQAEVSVMDSGGRACDTSSMKILPGDAWKHKEQSASLKLLTLSGVSVDEITKQGFVKAVISWDTNTYATSELEYRRRGRRPRIFRLENQFTKEHNVVLDGLKHNSMYSFRAVSRDIYGNTIRSEEYPIDTSVEFSRTNQPHTDTGVLPAVSNLQVFSRDKDNGLYLKISLNQPSTLSVKIIELGKLDKNHGFGLLPARHSRIDICYSCHPHDSSHPVGVKAVSPKIKIPQGLPTIEGGIITCVTCHEPHGGNRVHYNRYDYKKDLCMRCHLQKYSM